MILADFFTSTLLLDMFQSIYIVALIYATISLHKRVNRMEAFLGAIHAMAERMEKK